MTNFIALKSLAAGRLQDEAGNALQNRRVKVYLHGTSTPATVYPNPDGSGTPLSQPPTATELLSDPTGGVPGYVQAETDLDVLDVATGQRLQGEAIAAEDIAGVTLPASVVFDASSSPKDIDSTGVANGQGLVYDSVSGKFKPAGVGGSGVTVGSPQPGHGVTYSSGGDWVSDIRPIDVRNVVDSPDAVTDWGPIINGIIASGAKALYFGPGAYPYSTPIDASLKMGLAFLGPGGKVDIYGNSGLGWSVPARMPAYLLYTGTGTTPALDAHGGSGFTMRGIGLYYNNDGFTGKVIELGPEAAGTLIERCDVGAFDREHLSALAIVGFGNAYNCTIRDCTMQGAKYIIYANSPTGHGNEYSDSMRIRDNDFAYVSEAHIGGSFGNAGNWLISKNFMSLTLAPALPADAPFPQIMHLEQDATNPVAVFRLEFSDCWDSPTADPARNRPVLQFDQEVEATIVGNDIQTRNFPMIKAARGGWLRVIANPTLGMDQGGAGTGQAMIDLGDVSAGALPFERVVIKRNGPMNTGVAAVKNIKGHRGVEIDASATNDKAPSMREVVNQERVPIANYVPSPTISAGPALGAGSAQIKGNDRAGIIHLAFSGAPTAGKLATVNLGSALIADPQSPYGFYGHAGYAVHLTPLFNGSAPPAAYHAIECGLYALFDETDLSHWTLCAADAPAVEPPYTLDVAYQLTVV